MALARIFSCSPEQASTLIHDLERQGYKVEVLRPEETPAGPADLEIQYELCESSRVVERAQELASGLKADIAVDTGALDSVQFESIPEIVPIAMNPEASPMTITPELHAAALIMEQGNSNIEAAAPVELSAPMAPADHSPEPRRIPAVWSRATVAFLVSVGNLQENLRVLWLAAIHKVREQRERAAIHAAELRARRDQRLLELTCRRAEALQRSRQIESARRAAAGYLSQLQREPGATAREAVSASGKETAPKRFTWTPAQHMKSIAAGAAGAGALFALTLGISTLRSKPAAAPVKDAPVLASPQITVERTTAVPHEVATRPSPAVRAAQTATSARRAQSVARISSEEDDTVADDVVVRHFSHKTNVPIAKPAQKLQSSAAGGVKRYSDLGN